ncbi:MAG: VWA domain-containing protein [Gammaproteobacteria bacterium]|nr:VWA domain-containing protein [Gammaproteobacteria bacterium]
MNTSLSRFLEALRQVELRVSPAEALDAYRTVATIGPGNRQLLKDALAIALAKSEGDKIRLDETFDRFFAPAIDAEEPAPLPEHNIYTEGLGEAAEAAAQLLSGDVAGITGALQNAANAVGLERMWIFTQKNQFTRRMLEQMGLTELERAINEAERTGDEARTAQLQALRGQLFDTARDFVEREFDLFAKDKTRQLTDERLRNARLGAVDLRDRERMQTIVRRMAKQLAALYSSKRRREKHGTLDVRKTMRKNHTNDDVLFRLEWKHKKRDRPKLMVICDVSRSVSALSQFLLLFVHSLSEVLRGVRSFSLCSNLVETTAIFDNPDLDAALRGAAEAAMSGATDYGQALEDFEDIALTDVDRRTTVLILGDGRSNYTNPRVDLLRRIHDQARFVMWLNPEPRSFWGTGDSEMLRYQVYADLIRTVNSLADLERAVSLMMVRAH